MIIYPSFIQDGQVYVNGILQPTGISYLQADNVQWQMDTRQVHIHFF